MLDITEIFDDYCVSFTGCGLGRKGRNLSQVALFVRKDFIDDNFALLNNSNQAFVEVISEIKTFKQKGVNQIQSPNIVSKNSTNYELIKSVKSTLIEKRCQTDASGNTKNKKNESRNSSNVPEKSRIDKKFFTENSRIVQKVKYFSSYVKFTNQIESSLNSLVWEVKSGINVSDKAKMRKMTNRWDFEIEDYEESIQLSKHPYKCETGRYLSSASTSCDCEDREDCCGSSNCSYVPYELFIVCSDDMEYVELDTVKEGVIVIVFTVFAIPLQLAMDYINLHDEEKLRKAMKETDSFVTLEFSGIKYFKFAYVDPDSDLE